MNWLLTIVTFLPLVGILAILLTNPPKRGSENLVRWTSPSWERCSS